jgi:hypothetical protein
LSSVSIASRPKSPFHSVAADARRTGENHVPAGRRDRQILFPPPALNLEARQQFVDFGLDGAEPDHGIEVIERVIRGP